ncbi:MAG TPA: hypothetical protein VFE50_10255 [Cyclobacteriaceae bacterium]|nr:hypothetical protein [Cyclobacteriaceae bacterium]
MKTTLQSNPVCRYALLILISISTLGCSQKVKFDVSTVEPSAEGTVKINKDKNDNYQVDLNVIRLSDPERLTPPKATYVVWMETSQNGTQNIGQLKSNEALFSKALKSSLSSVTPYQPLSFFITAEEQGNITSPAGTVVLRTGRVK